MPFSTIAIDNVKNEQKRQNKTSEKFTHQLHFLKICCKVIHAMLLAQTILHKLILRQQSTI